MSDNPPSVGNIIAAVERIGGTYRFQGEGGFWIFDAPPGYRWAALSGSALLYDENEWTPSPEARIQWFLNLIGQGIVRLATLDDLMEDVAMLGCTTEKVWEETGLYFKVTAPPGSRWKSHSRAYLMAPMVVGPDPRHPVYVTTLVGWMDEGLEPEPPR